MVILEQLIPDLLLIISALEAIIFAVFYGVFFNYRKTSAGRALMEFVVGLIIVFIINTIGTFVGASYVDHEYPGRVFVRTIGYGYLAYTLGRLILVLWRNRHREGGALNIEPKKKRDIH